MSLYRCHYITLAIYTFIVTYLLTILQILWTIAVSLALAVGSTLNTLDSGVALPLLSLLFSV